MIKWMKLSRYSYATLDRRFIISKQRPYKTGPWVLVDMGLFTLGNDAPHSVHESVTAAKQAVQDLLDNLIALNDPNEPPENHHARNRRIIQERLESVKLPTNRGNIMGNARTGNRLSHRDPYNHRPPIRKRKDTTLPITPEKWRKSIRAAQPITTDKGNSDATPTPDRC